MLSFDQDFVAGVYPLKVIDWSDAAIGAPRPGEKLSGRAPALCRIALRGR